ncbi:hypothetical protein Tco_0055780, partial [Tanacetum coccineum]
MIFLPHVNLNCCYSGTCFGGVEDLKSRDNTRLIDGSGNEMLIKEVDVNPSGSLVVWSTVSKEYFDLISKGDGVSEDSMLISGFAISSHGHTTTSNTCGSVITLVLRMLVEGNQSLQETGQQAMESITEAINQTVERVKVALDKQRPPSPG